MEFIVREASEAQKRVTWTNTCNEWGRGINTTEYFSREERLESRSFTGENITVWVLCPKNNPDSLDLLSHLDAITHPAYFKTENGVEEVSIVSISSVFTPLVHRGKKYSSILIENLHKIWQSSGKIFGCSLYSDVGTYYERFGYSLNQPHDVTLPACKNPTLTLNLLDEMGVAEVSDWDCDLIKKELLSVSENTLVVAPTSANHDWHFERSKFYASKMRNTCPTVFGTRYEDEFLIWTHDYPNNRLTVLRHRLEKHSVLLLSIAQHYAHTENLGSVYFWNLNSVLIKGTELETVAQFRTRKEGYLPYIVSFKFKDEFKWDKIEYYNWV